MDGNSECLYTLLTICTFKVWPLHPISCFITVSDGRIIPINPIVSLLVRELQLVVGSLPSTSFPEAEYTKLQFVL